MGQYYRMLVSKTGLHGIKHYRVLAPYGSKLMEAASFRTSRPHEDVLGALDEIADNPCHVGWIGDYADDRREFDVTWGYAQPRDDAWSLMAPPLACREDSPVRATPGFLVNHSKGEFIDLGRYHDTFACKDGWAVHPLMLLTAAGNGRGSGDYVGYGGHTLPNEEKVGLWCMDELEWSEFAPEAMKDVTLDVGFCETPARLTLAGQVAIANGMHKGTLESDWIDSVEATIVEGLSWNGSPLALFDAEQTRALADKLTKAPDTGERERLEIDSDDGVVRCVDQTTGETLEEFESVTMPDGERLYAIGWGSWTWYEHEEPVLDIHNEGR